MVSKITISCLKNMNMENYLKVDSEIIFYYPICPTNNENVFIRKAKIVKKDNAGWGISEDYILVTSDISIPINKWKRILLSDFFNTEELRLA